MAQAYNIRIPKQKKRTASKQGKRRSEDPQLVRVRSLTPKVTQRLQQPIILKKEDLVVAADPQLDEEKEQELLRIAAEKKKRAREIKERQERLMAQLQAEKDAKNLKK